MKFKIHWFDRLASTNTVLKEQILSGENLPSGTVIAAKEQTEGRGRMGRDWISGAHENLTASLLIRGKIDLRQSPASGMAAALGTAFFLKEEEIVPSLKWPNDVQVNRKKICGILSERLPQGLVVGIGLNVNMKSAGHLDQPATSMRMETGREYDIEKILPRLLEKTVPFLSRWMEGGFSAVRADWEAMIPDLGRPVSVRDGETVREGVLEGFGENGELLLREGDGMVNEVWAGDFYA